MSKWKPGQLVTIDHHVYRVAKNNELCYKCDLFNRCIELRSKANFNCVKLVGVLCYFKKVI